MNKLKLLRLILQKYQRYSPILVLLVLTLFLPFILFALQQRNLTTNKQHAAQTCDAKYLATFHIMISSTDVYTRNSQQLSAICTELAMLQNQVIGKSFLALLHKGYANLRIVAPGVITPSQPGEVVMQNNPNNPASNIILVRLLAHAIETTVNTNISGFNSLQSIGNTPVTDYARVCGAISGDIIHENYAESIAYSLFPTSPEYAAKVSNGICYHNGSIKNQQNPFFNGKNKIFTDAVNKILGVTITPTPTTILKTQCSLNAKSSYCSSNGVACKSGFVGSNLSCGNNQDVCCIIVAPTPSTTPSSFCSGVCQYGYSCTTGYATGNCNGGYCCNRPSPTPIPSAPSPTPTVVFANPNYSPEGYFSSNQTCPYITGWACQGKSGQTNTTTGANYNYVNIDFFANAPYGQQGSQYIGSTTANVQTYDYNLITQKSYVCGNSTDHYFKFLPSPAYRKGTNIYGYMHDARETSTNNQYWPVFVGGYPTSVYCGNLQ